MGSLFLTPAFTFPATVAAAVNKNAGQDRDGDCGNDAAGGGITGKDANDAANDRNNRNKKAEVQPQPAVPDVRLDYRLFQRLPVLHLAFKKAEDAFGGAWDYLVISFHQFRRGKRTLEGGHGRARCGNRGRPRP